VVTPITARAAALLGCLAVLACGCRPESFAPVDRGSVARGRQAIERHGCGACHTIPGVRGARGIVGPNLEGLARRPFVAGALVNTPPNLIAWIRRPQAIAPRTAMPDLGVTEADARDIAAFLSAPR
jgi:cytochrome c2